MFYWDTAAIANACTQPTPIAYLKKQDELDALLNVAFHEYGSRYITRAALRLRDDDQVRAACPRLMATLGPI